MGRVWGCGRRKHRRKDIWGDPVSLADASKCGDLLPFCPSQPLSGVSIHPFWVLCVRERRHCNLSGTLGGVLGTSQTILTKASMLSGSHPPDGGGRPPQIQPVHGFMRFVPPPQSKSQS